MKREPSWQNSKTKAKLAKVSLLLAASVFVASINAGQVSAKENTNINPTAGTNVNASTTQDWRVPYVEGERKLKTQELEAAESAFREALRLVQKNKNSSAADIALCLQSLASVHSMQDRFYEEVLPLYKKAIKTLEHAYGKDSPKLVAVLVAFAGVREDEGDYKLASKLLTRALAITEKSDGKSSLPYADYYHRLGRVNFKLGYPRKAEEIYYSSLLTMMQQPVLPSSEILEQHLIDYIDLLTKSEQGRNFESRFQKELLKDSTSSFNRTQGVAASLFNKEVSSRIATQSSPNSSSLSSPGTNILDDEKVIPAPPSRIVPDKPMSDIVALEEINRQRVAFYERMIETDILSLGPEHPSVARDLSGLAALYLSQRKFAEAKPLLQRSLAIYEKVYSPESSMVKKNQALLQLVEDEQNPQSPANTIAIADYVSGLPQVPLAAQKLEVALRLNYLAFLCYCQGKLANSEKIYSWAVAATAKSAGEQSLLAASSLLDFSRVLRSTGRQSDAENFDNTAQAIVRRSISQNAAKALP